ncbi:hypothetical protein V462_06645 [Pantoea ananatis 15320]|nr:hypothetical protein V462_06645 [Pantoea ananatis 15320]
MSEERTLLLLWYIDQRKFLHHLTQKDVIYDTDIPIRMEQILQNNKNE